MSASHKARADDLLARDYETLRGRVTAAARARLVVRKVHADPADMDAFYNQAWHGLHTELSQGGTVDNHAGWLVTVTTRRALDEHRRLHRDRRADDAEAAEQGVDVDLAAQLDDAAKLRAFIEGLRDRLSERECQAATLCYLQGLTRPEAAEVIGVEPKRLEKIMDGVSRKVGEFVAAIESGGWCEARSSLMRAFAFGILDVEGQRYARAREHLRACVGCRRYVRSLRGLGALLPPVPLPLGRLGEPTGLLDHVTDWLREAKHALQGLGPGPEAGGLGAAGGVGAKLAAGAAVATIAAGGVAIGRSERVSAPPPARVAAAPAATIADTGAPEGERTRLAQHAAHTRQAREAKRERRAAAAERKRRERRPRRARPSEAQRLASAPAPAAAPTPAPAPASTAPAPAAAAPAPSLPPAAANPAPSRASGEFGFEG